MSRQVGGKPRAKPPRQSYRGYGLELYEEVDMQEEKISMDTNRSYAAAPERSQSQQQPRQQPCQQCHQQPHQQPYQQCHQQPRQQPHQQPAPSVAEYPVQPKESRKPMNKAHLMLVAVISVFLLCTVVLCLLAVILYRPQNDNSEVLMSKLEQLEKDMENLNDMQETNTTSQLLTSANSQLSNMQNLYQSLSLSLLNFREDLDRLRSINIYQHCIQETRSCTLYSGGSNFWRACHTAPNLHISPSDTQAYTVTKRCEYESTFDYYDSATLYKSGDGYYCRCDVSNPSGSYHTTLSTSFFATCTLVVTRCPRSVNLLS